MATMTTRFGCVVAGIFAATIVACTTLPTTPRGLADGGAGGISGEVGSSAGMGGNFAGVEAGTIVDTGGWDGAGDSMLDAPIGTGGVADTGLTIGKDGPVGVDVSIGSDGVVDAGGTADTGGVDTGGVDRGGVGTGGVVTGGSGTGGAATGGSGTGGGGTGGSGTGGAATGGSGTGGAATGGSGSGGVGMGTGGSGTGGMPASCQGAATQCSSSGLQTCSNGQWSNAIPCGPHESCTVTAGAAKCVCSPDPVCSTAGNVCADTATLATCAQDAQTGCIYQSSASTCSTGLVCERYLSPACVDPNWAEWPMPNGPADVAAGAPNPESYTDNGDQTVTDNVTGLMWQQAIAPGTYSNAAALAYCPTLTLGGHSDWRLPSIIELVSIVDYGSSTLINGTYFPGAATAFMPSTSPGSWIVSFGTVNYGPPIMGSVRCVR
jgi:hypothetical protein